MSVRGDASADACDCHDDMPPGPCVDGITLVRIYRCVEGVYQAGVIDSTTLCPSVSPAMPMGGRQCKGGANAHDVLMTAIQAGHAPADVLALAKAVLPEGK